MRSRDPQELFEQAAAGDRASLGRLLTLVERGGDPAREVARLAHQRAGRAYTVGITGAPGAGKSTLTDALIHHLRGAGIELAVLAVDPSSPFTGGAILGDRVRMTGHAGDDGVFIRSMASRGHLGGLALAVPEAVRVLDAAGFRTVIVETVGVGQVEVAIADAADTTVVVVNPGWGDAVQASKAGLLETADVLVVNKADRGGADAAVQDLEGVLQLVGSPTGHWRPPVVVTSAVDGGGVPELWTAVTRHRELLEASGALDTRRRQRLATELREIMLRRLEHRAAATIGQGGFEALVDDVANRRLDPWSAAEMLLSAGDLPPSAGGRRTTDGRRVAAMADGSAFVRIERGAHGVVVLRIDRPRANALSTEVVRQLAVAAQVLTEDPPGAVVVWGGRLLFAAGADITELTTGSGEAIPPEEAMAISDGFRAAYDAVAGIPRLTVAAISGYALGGGCELALACDLRVCADNARLGLPEILLGIIPGGGGTQRLARLVGPSRAKDLILTGRQVGAEEALRIGLVDRVVPREEVLAAATGLAVEAAKGALVAQALGKRAVDEGLEATLDDGLSLEAELFGQVFRTADAATGVRSFLADGPGKAKFDGR